MSKIFATFILNNQEYSIDASQIQEVIRLDNLLNITKVPLTPKYFLGLHDLRGDFFPVIDSSSYFYDESSDVNKSYYLVLINDKGYQFGLLFDQIKEITSFEYKELSIKSNDYIKNVFKEGNRIVQNINVDNFLIKESAYLIESTKVELKPLTVVKNIIFTLNKIKLSVDITDIAEIINYPTSITKNQFMLDGCLGEFILRGEKILLYSLSQYFGLEDFPANEHTKVLVFKNEDYYYAFQVDSVDELSTYIQEYTKPVPSLGLNKKFFNYAISSSPLILSTNFNAIGEETGVHHNSRGHFMVFSSKNNRKNEEHFSTQNYILFECDTAFAVRLSEVQELINVKRSEISKIPRSNGRIEGVYSLRDNLISIYDLKKLYNWGDSTEENVQVIIFRENPEAGFIVEKAIGIESIRDKDEMKSDVITQFSKYNGAISSFVSNGKHKLLYLSVKKVLNKILDQEPRSNLESVA